MKTDPTDHVNVYVPDQSIQEGYFSIFREIGCEFQRSRWLTYQLFRRDFSATYKQSFMGIFWVLVIPLFSVMTFVMLNRSGVLRIGEISAPYPIYAVLGIAFWQFFAAGIVASANSLVDAGQMIKIINFSKKSLVIAATGRAMVAFLVQMALAVILFMVYRFTPRIEIVWLPLALIPLVLLTWGCGFIFSLLNAVMRDVGNALSMLTTFLMFLTPVLYAKPETGALSVISRWNPLFYLVSSLRDLVIAGRIVHLKGFLISSLFSAAVFLGALVFFHLTETRITERV